MRGLSSGLARQFCIISVLLLFMFPVCAEEPRYVFDIPAGPLDYALLKVGQISHTKIMFASEKIRSMQANPVNGEFTVQSAIFELLKGSGLNATRTESGILIIRLPPESSLDAASNVKLASAEKVPSKKKPEKQSSTPADPLAIEEIIVTARRKEENLQTVPVSVTVLRGEALKQRGITNLTNLQTNVPSLRIQASDVNPKAFLVGMRGLKSGTYAATEDSVVGTYFAEVVQAHPYAFGATMFDLQSVQILKGPQGTLFGRNHTAGAILIEPNKASISEGNEGSIKLGLGDYSMKEFEGVGNWQINDISALRMAYRKFQRDGYTTNILTGQKFDGSDETVLRMSYLIKPTTNITSHTIYDYFLDDGGPMASLNTDIFRPQISAANLAVFGPAVAFQQSLGPRKFAAIYGTGIGGFGNTTAPGNDMRAPTQCLLNAGNRICRKSFLPTQEIISKGLINNSSWVLGDVTIKNIIGYRKASHVMEAASVLSPVPVASPIGVAFSGEQRNRQNQLSEELQFSGKAFEDQLDWITGGFYFRERFTEYAPGFAMSTTNYNITQGYGENKAKAIFGQGSYKFNDQWKVTLGLRRNFDTRSAVNNTRIGYSVVTGLPDACQFRDVSNVPLPDNACQLSGERSWAATTWNVSLEYQMDKETLLYVAMRKGYKSGGFSRNAAFASRLTFDPEFVKDIELGAKSDMHWGTMPIRLNAALYKSDITDMQLNVAELLPGTTSTFVSFTNNAGKAQVTGAEFEATFLPTGNLELTGFLGYTNPKYLTYFDPAGGTGGTRVDLSDVPFGIKYAVPKWQAGLNASYKYSFEERGTLILSADWTLRSRASIDNVKWFALKGTAFSPQMPDPGHGLLNLRADWERFLGNPVLLSLFINNATDKVYKDGGTQVLGIFSSHYAPPRMFGVELAYKFGEGFKPRD